MDDGFFEGFSRDLHNADIWKDYHTEFRIGRTKSKDLANPAKLGDPVSVKAEGADSSPIPQDQGSRAFSRSSDTLPSKENKPIKRLKDLANPTLLGDPISLKAEAADSTPTDQDRGAQSPPSKEDKLSSGKKMPEKRLKDLANPTQLGDPVSLKAEAADSSPTDQDRGAQVSSPQGQILPSENIKPKPRLKGLVNPTQLGDPVSLKAESTDSIPADEDRGAQPRAASSLSSLTSATSTRQPLQAPQASTTMASEITPPKPLTSHSLGLSQPLPPLPTIDTTTLFWSMMAFSRNPNPHIYPALLSLHSSRRFILGALSNTVTFFPTHPYSASHPLLSLFDIFVSSAAVGLRKPDRAIYELAMDEVRRIDGERGGSGVEVGDVLFLDDIGENVRMGEEMGWRVVKVRLGRTEEAVMELEKETEMQLSGKEEVKAKL